MKINKIHYFVLPAILVLTWLIISRYTFNPNPDLNGDNFYYYMYATSLASGKGYSDISAVGNPPSSTYPPGYPAIMTPIRFLTDSIIVQKWLNELFVLLGVLLIYFILLRHGFSIGVCFTVAFAGLFCPRLWHFSTMMMAEASFFGMSLLAIYALYRMSSDEKTIWSELRSPWFYVMLAASIFTYYIRTQGLALMAAVCFVLLIRKRWGALLASVGGFIAGYMPWSLRNKALGLSDRYFSMVLENNHWRPEEGTLSIGEVIQRFFETMKMLVFNAIPNSVVPFIDVDCDNPSYTVGIYILGALIVALICIGFWQMPKLRWLLIGYIGATLSIISLFSTPSGNRYITAILPILTMGLFLGIWFSIQWILRLKWKQLSFSAFFLIPLVFLSQKGLAEEHLISTSKTPINYQQFFAIGTYLKQNVKKDAVICSRKPTMLYFYSERYQTSYLWTENAEELLIDLIDKNVSYVVLDNLGYSSTPRYLYPAIQKYPQFFPEALVRYDNTGMYLLRFDRKLAASALKK